jgi:hypothetical protein
VDDLKPFVKKMTVKQHSFNSFIFTENQVCILLSGSVEMNYHTEKVNVVKPVGKFHVGDILGFKQGDRGMTTNVQAWAICTSAVEAIWMNPKDFAFLWAKQQKYA